jgi:hypothetical protein
VIIYNFNFPIFTAASLVPVAGGLTSGSVYTGIIFPGTNKSFLLLEVDVEGSGSSSAPSTFSIFRTITSAASGALTTVITGQPTVSLSSNPSFTGSAGQGSFATTQATLASASSFNLSANANGQRYFWRANPNLSNALDVPGTATALLNGIALVQVVATGTSVIAAQARIQVGEI